MLRNPKYIYDPEPSFVPAKLHLGDFLIHKFKKYGDKVAMINGATHEELRCSDILQSAMNIAVSLVKIGVNKGDVVGICAEALQEYWATVVGIICTGATMTPFSSDFKKDELKHVMNLSKPKYFFCTMDVYNTHQALFKSLDYLKTIIIFGDERVDDLLLYKDLAVVSKTSVVTKDISYEEFETVDVNGSTDTAFIVYSSGTTGLPKGVMQTHLNVISIYCLSGTVDPKLKILNVTPWYHVFGLMTGFLYICQGAEVVYLPKFEMDLYLKTIEKYKINQLVVIPSIVVALSKTIMNYDVSSVYVILCAAAVLEMKTIDAVEEKFPYLEAVIQGYGLSESTFVVSIDTFYKNGKCKRGCVGKVLSDVVLKVVDIETRQPLGPYQHGELCIKGPMIFKGYVGESQRSDIDDEGFLITGDIGYYDEDKYFYIIERLKELIKFNGFQVPPAEIEAVLLEHPGVRDAGVVGMPQALSGEVPVAFVVLQPGFRVTEIELQKFVAERLSNPKHLRGGVRFIAEIPRTGSGKIIRKNLRALLK